MSDIQALTSKVQQLGSSATLWNRLALWAVAATAIVAALYFVFSLIASRKNTALQVAQAELNRAKDSQLTGDLKDKDVAISAADQKAADAKKETARLTKEAEQAKTERAEADKQIAIAKADAAKAKEGIANAEAVSAKAGVEVARLQVVVANAETRRLEAERELAEVKRLQLPRSIPLNLRDKLVQELSRFSGQVLNVIEPVSSDLDASQFAGQIEALTTSAGWKYNVVMRSGATIIASNARITPPHGLICVVGDPANPPAAARVFVKVMREAGAKIEIEGDARLKDAGIIGPVIGLKPIE